MRFGKIPFRATLVKQYIEKFSGTYKPVKHVISPSESHSAKPHIVYAQNRPARLEPAHGQSYRLDREPRKPDPVKMCF